MIVSNRITSYNVCYTKLLRHSTSGSHERYKSPERLQWEERYDCLRKMREWILQSAIASDQELDSIEQEAVRTVREARNRAWQSFQRPIRTEAAEALALLDAVRGGGSYNFV